MRLVKYLEFIKEAKGVGKMMIFYSDSFRDILSYIESGKSTGSRIANLLLAAEESNQSLDTYTLIDKTDLNDKISYVQTSRIQREYSLDSEDMEDTRLSNDDKFWKTGRTPNYGIGRWVRHIFSDVFKVAIDDKELEEFVNAYKSSYDKIKNGSDGFEIVKGEDIKYWYHVDRYQEVKGQLGKSCMRYDYCQKYLDIYVKNPDVCQLLILKGDTDEKIIGRALIWKDTNGKLIMDRIYTINDSDKLRFEEYAKQNNILTSISGKYVIKVTKGRYDYYPYMDTFCYYDYDDGILTNIGSDSYIKLQNTDGTPEENEGRIWSEWHGEYIEEDDARWCDDVDDYVHYENAIYLEYMDRYVSENADVVWSEYAEQSFYREDTVWSECMNDYLYKEDNDIIIFKINNNDDYDYCMSDGTKYYFKLNDEYYSKEYIQDPYTGEYHFKDEIVDGEKFINTLENKIEKELNIKGEYTVNGQIDWEKYKLDLRKMLLDYTPNEEILNDIKAHRRRLNIGDLDTEAFILPGLYAWILINETLKYRSSLNKYGSILYSILDDMSDDFLKNQKEEIRKMYKDRIDRDWMTPIFYTFECIDLTKFPTEIYKRILYLRR
jgi:hypothetical protein